MSTPASRPVEQVLARLTGVRRSGSGWSARCPAHEDRNPSLSVAEGAEGRVRSPVTPAARSKEIVLALGLLLGDLFPVSGSPVAICPKPTRLTNEGANEADTLPAGEYGARKGGSIEGHRIAGKEMLARRLAAAAASVLAILLAPRRSVRDASDRHGQPRRPECALGLQRGLGMVEQRLQRGRDGKPPHAAGGRDYAGLALGQSIPRSWAYVEDVRGTYDWTISDVVYAAMQQSVKPIMLLHRAPPWARDPAATCPFGAEDVCAYPPLPEYDSEWKSFVQAAVARYPNVRAVEIWNEPEPGVFWAPAADPEPLRGDPEGSPRRSHRRGQRYPCPGGRLVPRDQRRQLQRRQRLRQ